MGALLVITLDEVWRRYEAGDYRESPTLSVDQVRALLGMDSVETVYRHLRQGVLPAYRVGRSWVIYRDMLRDFLDAERAARESSAQAEERTPTPGGTPCPPVEP